MNASPSRRPEDKATRVVETIEDVRDALDYARKQSLSVGLVPTMGYFHEGHLSLMRRARAECGFVAVSIYVNPTQFAADEDLDTYPRDFDRDLKLAEAESVDAVFTPDDEEMYGTPADEEPPGAGDMAFRAPHNYTAVEPGTAAEGLCGRGRPGHFRGVATVVAKLLNIFQPDNAYFGQKDAQQAAVITQMARELDFNARIRVLPTVREASGLALSSRNAYLSPDELEQATVLFRALSSARSMAREGERDPSKLVNVIVEMIISTPGVALEYAEVVDADTMRPVARVTHRTLAAVAARVGEARLIDNIFLLGGME